MQTEKILTGIRAWFEAALDIPSASRVTWLEKNCPSRALRQRVLELIAAHESPDEPISQPVGEWFLALDDEFESLEDEPDQLIGKNIAGFELLRHLGSGGMSSVYLGRRSEADFDQLAAVKVLKHSIFSATEQRMFRRERQLLAELEHPNIARFIDGGVTDIGLPYMIMEYVDGTTITSHCERHSLDSPARVKLFLSVCRATDHAHRASIIHRDIKPANVLVNSEGLVKLLDFGIAKLVQPEKYSTVTAKVYLTPEYAAPEQFEKGKDSTAADVYSLGILLHEMLIGIRPNRSTPAKPSLAALQSTTGNIAHLKTKSLQRYLAGDLDNIIERATQEDPILRYRNAGELADDIERFLQGQPVEAHPPSTWYRTKKFVHRHRGAVWVTFALLLALLTSLGLAVWQAKIARSQANLARIEAIRANQVKTFLLELFEAAQESLPADERPTPADLVKTAMLRLSKQLELDAQSRLELLLSLARVGLTSGAYPESLQLIQQAQTLIDGQTPQSVAQVATVLHADVLVKLAKTGAAIALLDPLLPLFRVQEDETAINALIVRSQAAADMRDAKLAVELADLVAEKAARLIPASSRKSMILALAPGRARANVGENNGAEEKLIAGLQAWRASTISKDDEFAVTLGTLAVVQFRLGKSELGLQAIDESIELLRTLHARPTSAYITLLTSRAAYLGESRVRDAGISDSLTALNAASTLYGSEHPYTLTALLSRAQIISRVQSRELGNPLYKDLISRCELSKQMPNSSTCFRALSGYAMNLIKLRKLDAAEPFLLRGLALRREKLGDRHPEVAAALSSLGVLRAAQNRHEEALQKYDEALLILIQANAPENMILAQLRSNRAGALRDLALHSEALPALDQAIALYDALAPADTKTRFQLRAWKALSLHTVGQTAPAKSLANQALEIGGRDAIQGLSTIDQQQFRLHFSK
jgi:eukaryotic-like serine/threonine-protein kinase